MRYKFFFVSKLTPKFQASHDRLFHKLFKEETKLKSSEIENLVGANGSRRYFSSCHQLNYQVLIKTKLCEQREEKTIDV